jgi:hypothetical protein
MSTWKLATPDKILAMSLDASDNGPMKGTLTYDGVSFPVNGGWVASGSVSGRNFSAFALYGSNQVAAPDWISAAGIMTGPGNRPTQIDIQVDISSSPSGRLSHYSAILLPV